MAVRSIVLLFLFQMVLQPSDLAGDDAMTPLRLKAWEALGKWITHRCSRHRGVHVPNLFQIFWQVTSNEGTSKLKRPFFILSPRFCENYGVRSTQSPPGNVPAPASGDDINFYHLSLQFSSGLSKDQAFVATRDMFFRLGEAAAQGRELQLSLGAGVLIIADRTATFEWDGGLGVGSGGAAGGGRLVTSSLDPLSGRQRDAPSGLRLMGSGARSGFGSECSGSVGGMRLSAEEEARRRPHPQCLAPHSPAAPFSTAARTPLLHIPTSPHPPHVPTYPLSHMAPCPPAHKLPVLTSSHLQAALFSEVDRLDPEGRVEGRADAASAMCAAELEQPTKEEIGRLLALPTDKVAEQSVEELGAALGAKAAALEAQLLHSRTQNAKLEQVSARACGALGSRYPMPSPC